MKFIKIIATIFILSTYLSRNFYSMKSSCVNLIGELHASRTPNSHDYRSVYELNRLCDDIIAKSNAYDPETLILITSNLCHRTFTNIKKILSNKYVTEDSLYILDILEYIEIIAKTNIIIFNIILKPDGDKKVLPPFEAKPTNTTKQSLNKAFFTVSSALKKYENIFSLPLNYELKNYKTIRKIHDNICHTWKGLWIISESPNFKD